VIGDSPNAILVFATAARSATLSRMPTLGIKATHPWLILRLFTDYTSEGLRTLCTSPDELRARWAHAGLVMAKGARGAHSRSMKMAEYTREMRRRISLDRRGGAEEWNGSEEEGVCGKRRGAYAKA